MYYWYWNYFEKIKASKAPIEYKVRIVKESSMDKLDNVNGLHVSVTQETAQEHFRIKKF